VEAADTLGEVPEEVVVHCKSGARSRDAVLRLREVGVTGVLTLEGGILGWREAIDPALPRY
ncbi:MAG: rhodanese-like domain-containing protein, partial [Longimicrobiales bacterium]|nr:rhodanese-like domain-containing protein [Longimicrobiales bacterium]